MEDLLSANHPDLLSANHPTLGATGSLAGYRHAQEVSRIVLAASRKAD